MPHDIGENLVASYLRYVERCDFVVHNTHLEEEQGEVDVVGMKFGAEPSVIFCEVTTHIRGMQYGSSYDRTVAKVADKIRRARVFAESLFPDVATRYEIWSPSSRSEASPTASPI